MTKLFKLDGDEVREYTETEYEQAAKDQAEFLANEAKKELELEEAKKGKAAAKAKLEALGLSLDDLKALGLG
jgi:hypothetical protein